MDVLDNASVKLDRMGKGAVFINSPVTINMISQKSEGGFNWKRVLQETASAILVVVGISVVLVIVNLVAPQIVKDAFATAAGVATNH